jgi:hypothetical protein
MNGWDMLDGFSCGVKPVLRRPFIVTLPTPVEGVDLAAHPDGESLFTFNLNRAADNVCDTMPLIPMSREVQGQGHSTTPLLRLMNTRGGSAQAISLGVDVFDREGVVW